MSSIMWTVQQSFQQSEWYWKFDNLPTTVIVGMSAYPLLIIPKVDYPRLVNFSITGESQTVFQLINFYLDHPTATAEHLGIDTAIPDFQARVGHQQLNWELSAGLYAKKTDGNENGIKITYRCAVREPV